MHCFCDNISTFVLFQCLKLIMKRKFLKRVLSSLFPNILFAETDFRQCKNYRYQLFRVVFLLLSNCKSNKTPPHTIYVHALDPHWTVLHPIAANYYSQCYCFLCIIPTVYCYIIVLYSIQDHNIYIAVDILIAYGM